MKAKYARMSPLYLMIFIIYRIKFNVFIRSDEEHTKFWDGVF